ncbi:MAG: MmgE/PrpD family protein [Desulfobacter sp.]|nr:MmgE/PrpD family protein [Desulfobacter sp.]
MRSNPSVFGLSRDLARYAVSFSLDQTPCEVIDYAQYLILDLLGAALAGVATPEAKAAQNAVRMLAGQGPCTLWGTPHHTTAGGAALANGICAHARELDDFGGGGSHRRRGDPGPWGPGPIFAGPDRQGVS